MFPENVRIDGDDEPSIIINHTSDTYGCFEAHPHFLGALWLLEGCRGVDVGRGRENGGRE